MKRITAVMITLAMLAGVASCTKNTNEPAQTNAGTTVTTVGEVALDVPQETTETATETTVTEVMTTETVTAAPAEEPFDIEVFLSTIPVYEYKYENYEYARKFDRIAEDEYAKFEAGEEVSKLYGVRLTEYPDIVLIGQVITDPGLEQEYQKRGLNSVIYNGERYYTPNYNDGVPGYGVDITEDFVCVTSAANHYAHAYFIYDGGVEYINFFNSEFARALDRLYVSDGVMNYSCYSTQYSSIRFTPASLYTEYRSPEDCLYYEGTVELEDGKIEINTKSYTVAEWYATQTDLQEKSGTTDVAEFVVWLKENIGKDDVHIDPIRMYKPRS